MKKAQLFSIMVVLIFLISALSAFIMLDKKYGDLTDNVADTTKKVKADMTVPKRIGEKQLQLFSIYAEAEKAQFYIEKAAELAAEEALYDLGSDMTGCGDTQDGSNTYTLLYADGKKCLTDSSLVLSAYSASFSRIMAKYLQQYPTKEFQMPHSFSLSFKDGKLIAMADQDLAYGAPQRSQYVGTGQCSHIIEKAKEYLGCPYYYNKDGGTVPPDPSYCGKGMYGFTCATFVQTIVSRSGGPSLHGNGDQICRNAINAGHAIKVSRSELQPGDLVSMGGGDYGHTGIYEEGNMLIHSTTGWGAGQKVKESDLDIVINGRSTTFCRLKSCIGPAVVDGTKVCVDAGHKDTDERGFEGGFEGKNNLEIALKLKLALEKKGLEVFMTRIGSVYPNSEAQRKHDINNAGCSISISIHSNAGGGSGTQTYVCNQKFKQRWDMAPSSLDVADAIEKDGKAIKYIIRNDGMDLAKIIHPLVVKAFINKDANIHMDTEAGAPRRDPSVVPGPGNMGDSSLGLVCRTHMPSILIEVGFHDRVDEAKKLKDSVIQQRVADAIAQGAAQFLKK